MLNDDANHHYSVMYYYCNEQYSCYVINNVLLQCSAQYLHDK